MAWFVSRRNCQSFLTTNTVAGPLDRAGRSGRADSDHQDPPAAVLRPGRATHPLGAPPHSASPPALALGNPVQPRPGPAASHSIPSLTAPPATDSPTSQPKVSAISRQTGPGWFLAASSPRHPARLNACRRPSGPGATTEDPPQTSPPPQWSPGHLPRNCLTPLPLSSCPPSVPFGGFGLSRAASRTRRRPGRRCCGCGRRVDGGMACRWRSFR